MNRTAALLIFLSIFQAISSIGCFYSTNEKNIHRLNKFQSTAVDNYMIEVARQVNKNWKFEKRMESKPSQVASIIFKIMPNGEIQEIYFAKRSGNVDLDQSAYNAVVKTNPTKPFPNNIKKPYVRMGLRFCPDGIK